MLLVRSLKHYHFSREHGEKESLQEEKPDLALTIGNFDGLHEGQDRTCTLTNIV